MNMQCVAGTRRRVRTPHRLDQRVEVDDEARPHGKCSEDRAFPGASDDRRCAAPPTQLDRPQQSDVHNGSIVVGHGGTIRALALSRP